MGWTSKTGQFCNEEISIIEQMDAGTLARALLGSDPIVALRALAEILLHEDARLEPILADTNVQAHWQQYIEDYNVRAEDHGYAEELKKRTR